MLKGDEAALITAAASGQSHADIAAAADVSISTVQRRLRDPEIGAAVQEARTEQRLQMAGRLNQVMAAAIDKLEALVLHEDPRIALRAIGIVMGSAQQFAATAQTDEGLRQPQVQHVGGEQS